MRHHPRLLIAAAALLALPALAAPSDADLALGERLIRENRCDECHARRFGRDGLDIYRPAGRISTPAALRAQVEYCSSQLNLGFFAEEIDAISAVLNRDHYKFKPAK